MTNAELLARIEVLEARVADLEARPQAVAKAFTAGRAWEKPMTITLNPPDMTWSNR